jgi:carboxylate-amine ligase
MAKIEFNSNDSTTLGIEIELGLVDAQSMALSNSMPRVLEEISDPSIEWLKPELVQSCLEINTGICRTVDEAEADLSGKIRTVEAITDQLGLRLWWGATHPFSHWKDQEVTATDRYLRLVELLQDMARRLVTFGLHVHVGVDSGDKAIMICDRIMHHLPTLLALSCSSPCWQGRLTGLQSQRSKIMEGLPTAGLPSLMRNWSEYVWLVNHLVDTGFINSIREIWWDVRPHHNFGTVEVRVCDMPGNLEDVLTIAALIQSLVKALSDDIDEGAYQHACHPMLVRQNKWRACRFGNRAELVEQFTYVTQPVSLTVENLVQRLRPTARELQCEPQLERALLLATQPSCAQRQVDMLQETGDLAEVVRQLTAYSRLSATECA